MLEQIEQVLNEQVRPSLRGHGGEVEVLELDGEGTLHIRLLGQCSGCPSAIYTTESLIEEALVTALPNHVRRVVLVQQVSEDLLRQARAILSQPKPRQQT